MLKLLIRLHAMSCGLGVENEFIPHCAFSATAQMETEPSNFSTTFGNDLYLDF